MEKDIERIKNNIAEFIEKYSIKAFRINTKVEYH